MLLGLGIDIIEIERIKDSIERLGNRFLEKIYTQSEIKYCSDKANKYQHFAARFAAKEAVYKAIASSWQPNIGWQEIEIYNEPTGLPVVKLKGKLKDFLGDDKSLKISMSHSRDYVTCVAIIYK
ncbi:MAG: holo-ACP synthase, partial [Ignavibacteriaceae bacterium]|nr:holo-ACP synthase [Ignavibacteriaceae bacterium]